MRQLFVLLGLVMPIGVASAQTFGEITGEVTDQSGAIAPNASVTATNTATNGARMTRTNQAGIYSFPALVPGPYQVKVEATGFQSAVRSNIELQVQQTARVDFTLTVGQTSQTVEVSGTALLLTTESATVGTVIEQKSIVELPLNGRDFLQLVALSPNVTFGFQAPNQAVGRQGGTRATENIAISGMRGTWNNYTLDGVSNTDVNFNLYIQLPSVDALQEFKVQTGIYPAEFGREASQINVSTKPGLPPGTNVAPALRAPYPEFPAGIELTEGGGRGSYNGLSVKLSQRFKSGLTTLLSYTWSKALDDGSAIRGNQVNGSANGDMYPENPLCRRCEKGPSAFNTPNRLVTSILYELPLGKGKPLLNHGGGLNQLVGGWQTSAILTAQTGRPLYAAAAGTL